MEQLSQQEQYQDLNLPTDFSLSKDFDYSCEYTDNLPVILKTLNISLVFTSYQSSRLILVRSDGENIDVNFKHFPRPMGLVSSNEGLTLGTFSQIINFYREDGLLEKVKQPLVPIERDITAPKVNAEQIKSPEAQAADALVLGILNESANNELNEIERAAQDLLRERAKQQKSQYKNYREEQMQAVNEKTDACYIARSSHYTGMINLHDIDWGDDGLWVVNSSFSCLCTLDADYSFVPRWKPPFISDLVPEDRCHLNGMALKDGKPAYVTTFSQLDSAGAWRENDKSDTGTLMDVASNEILIDDLMMPHSPRWHNGKVYFCNSGLGQVCSYEPATREKKVVAELAGFTRGMAFHGDILIVATSKVRKSEIRQSIPIAESGMETSASITLINLLDNSTIAQLTFTGDVEQIYDVAVLTGCHYPELIEPSHPRMRNHFTHPKLQPLD